MLSIQKKISVALLAAFCLVLVPTASFAQDGEVEVTHGGYGAMGGALAFSALSLMTGNLGRVIYAPPLDADCRVEPERCESTALDHILMGSLVAATLAGTYFGGYGATKLAESAGWDPVLGWSLAGGYLGVPVSILVQNVIPQFEPDWARQTLGITLAAAGSVGSAFAFKAISERRGHAWPEFGFGVGGMALGLTIGSIFFPNTVWVPILGGVTSVLAASASTLAF